MRSPTYSPPSVVQSYSWTSPGRPVVHRLPVAVPLATWRQGSSRAPPRSQVRTPAGQPKETFDTTGPGAARGSTAHTLTQHARLARCPVPPRSPRAAASAATVAAAGAGGATYKYQTDAGFRREATFWSRVVPIIGHYAWTKRERFDLQDGLYSLVQG